MPKESFTCESCSAYYTIKWEELDYEEGMPEEVSEIPIHCPFCAAEVNLTEEE